MGEIQENGGRGGGRNPYLLPAVIVLGIIGLAGALAWRVSGMARQSAMEEAREAASQMVSIEKLIAKNPAPRDPSTITKDTVTYVLDASSMEKWVHFSFGKLTVFTAGNTAADSLEWDAAFRRAKILTNGGASGKLGKGEVTIAVGAKFDEVKTPPSMGWAKDVATENITENMNPALDKWYQYNFWTHKLKPRDEVYVLKTADGKFVKLQIMDYYCGKASGCYTIKFAFIGDGPGALPDAPRNTD